MSGLSRVTIYDRGGRGLATLSCVSERSWVLNGEGLCRLTISVNDDKVRKSILQYGNLIAIEHSSLPLWAGVLDTDRVWGESKLTLTAWSGERLLKFRRSPLNITLSGNTAGTLFATLIDIANRDEDLRVRATEVFNGGTPRDETLDGKNIYDHIKAISARTGYDWGVDGAFDSKGFLFFTANLYRRRGAATGQQLREGTNIVAGEDAYTETGTIVNDLQGIGDASTAATRIVYSEIDSTSRGLYGLRQASQDFNGNREIGTLIGNVQGVLAANKNPTKTLNIFALDVGSTFKALRLGNTLPLYMFTVGFLDDGTVGINTRMRIIGMRYNDELDQVSLVMQEELT